MLLSYNWLKSCVEVDLSVDDMSALLTAIGLEVEGVSNYERIPGGLQGVVVGQVITKEQHPNADRLSVTTVDIGGDAPLQVVCGAPNVAAGQRVAVATVGTTLYDADGNPWAIKKSKIRGERSEGMLCAEDELHLGASHEGIMVLDDHHAIGHPLSDYFDTGSDYIFDIGLTPNRSDATAHLGVAEDVAAALRVQRGASIEVQKPTHREDWADTPCPVEVEINDVEACPRYSGIVLEGIAVGPSPDWIRERLMSIGVRPINNVVDITNFILHEMGQPLHAFDLDKVSGERIIVDKLADGTPFVTLDGHERKLSDADLMICDGEKQPMCIAGVFGGEGSGVSAETKRIFLESAHFEAIGIRRSSMGHQLRTDAAKIYEKGSDPSITVRALHRAAELLTQYASAHVVGGLVDHYPSPIEPAEVTLRRQRIHDIIGLAITPHEIENILDAMGMSYQWSDADEAWTVAVPTNKADVTREIDLIEEVLRIYGYDRVPASPQLRYSMQTTTGLKLHEARKRWISRLTQLGFHQMMNMSLSRAGYYEDAGATAVRVLHPSNAEFDTLRQDLLHPALEAVSHNHRHQQRDLRLFEIGHTYRHDGDGFIEEESIICLLSGQRHEAHWQVGAPETDSYELKSVARMLWPSHAWSSMSWEAVEGGLDLIRGSSVVGRVRTIDAQTMERFELVAPVHYLEVAVKPCFKAWSKDTVTMKPVAKYPRVSRDLALVLPVSTPYATLVGQIRAAKQKRCVHHYLFDIYEDAERLGEGMHSLAVRFIFEDATKTMSDKEVDKMMAKISQSLQHIDGLSVRGAS